MTNDPNARAGLVAEARAIAESMNDAAIAISGALPDDDPSELENPLAHAALDGALRLHGGAAFIDRLAAALQAPRGDGEPPEDAGPLIRNWQNRAPTLSREAVARIIDPEAWADRVYRTPLGDALDRYHQQESLTKADAILALALPPAPQGWRDISTAPKDGTHFLAHYIDLVDEYDEDDRLVAKAVPTPATGIAYQVEWLDGIVEFPYQGRIVQGRRYTHWQPLPAAPSPTSQEGER